MLTVDECECGLFEHMGMLSCHVLKVMDFLGMTKVREKHIVKRWTKNARGILPEHLHHYQRDQLGATPLTFRHNQMYVQALELVRLGDASVKTYETLMGLFNQAMTVMSLFDQARDGLGLEGRVSGKKQGNGNARENKAGLEEMSCCRGRTILWLAREPRRRIEMQGG